jgi:hypothetical protein
MTDLPVFGLALSSPLANRNQHYNHMKAKDILDRIPTSMRKGAMRFAGILSAHRFVCTRCPE